MAVEEWNRAFVRALPVVSLGVGVFSAAIAILSLQHYGTSTQRVYSQDGTYLVNVRYGQWRDIREFVQPNNPQVQTIYSQFGPDYWSLYDFVCRDIDYRRDIGEFWLTPSETLASKLGDCEDTSLLLCSLLRNTITDAHVALGSFQGYGHAWCQYQGKILESTFTQARPVSHPEHYELHCLFNDQDIIELWPGALEEIFAIRRDEATKLNLMARAVG